MAQPLAMGRMGGGGCPDLPGVRGGEQRCAQACADPKGSTAAVRAERENRRARFAMLSIIATQTGTLRAVGWSLGKNCTLWLAYYAPKTVF